VSQAAGKSDLIDLTMHLHVMTERAVRVSDTGEDAKAVWLPLSQVEVARQAKGTVVVTLPEWLALQKGLI
jgi:hypothetical protein